MKLTDFGFIGQGTLTYSLMPPYTEQYYHSTLFFLSIFFETVLLWVLPLFTVSSVPMLNCSLFDAAGVLLSTFSHEQSTTVLVLFSLTATLVATWLRHRSICPTIASLLSCLNGKSLRNLSWSDILWNSAYVYRVKTTNHPITLVEHVTKFYLKFSVIINSKIFQKKVGAGVSKSH